MEILGIGPSELFFVIIIALIVLGPKEMQNAGRTLGRFLNNIIRSDGWKAFQQTSRELRNLPNRLMREANIETLEAEKQIKKAMALDEEPASSLNSNRLRSQRAEYTIQPPSAKPATADDTSNEQKA